MLIIRPSQAAARDILQTFRKSAWIFSEHEQCFPEHVLLCALSCSAPLHGVATPCSAVYVMFCTASWCCHYPFCGIRHVLHRFMVLLLPLLRYTQCSTPLCGVATPCSAVYAILFCTASWCYHSLFCCFRRLVLHCFMPLPLGTAHTSTTTVISGILHRSVFHVLLLW
jgi:hypothetical protein